MRCATLDWKRFAKPSGRQIHVKAPSIGMHTRRSGMECTQVPVVASRKSRGAEAAAACRFSMHDHMHGRGRGQLQVF